MKIFFVVVCFMATTLVARGQTSTIYKYTPDSISKTAVVVCPGGSYYWLAKKTEGKDVAKWLNDNHITAYVLEYSTSGWASFFFHIRSSKRNQYPQQLDQLIRAIHAAKLDGYEKVGVMGFSAGGHLALNVAIDPTVVYKPDFVTAIYPVITMNEPYVHARSRRGLLGERRQHSQTMRDSLSIELHTNNINCPVFIMNCKDDPTVDYHNANLFKEAMLNNPISDKCCFLQYETGGHGFGVNPDKTSTEAIKWKDEWLKWFTNKINNR